MIAFLKQLLAGKSDNRISIRDLAGDSVAKRRAYERALKGAAEDQKKVIADYHKKFGS
jgi:hypothetical protein